MTVNNPGVELLACEEYIMDRVDHSTGIIGEKKTTELIGSKKKQLFIRLLVFFRGFGVFFLYLNEAYKRRRYTFSVYQHKILFSDHASGLIQKKVLKEVDLNYKKNFQLQQLQSSFIIFVRWPSIVNIFKSFWRTKPASPAAFYELCLFWVYYTLYADWLLRSELSAVLVVDDFSTKRIALTLAAKDAGLRVGVVKMSDEPDRPFPFHGCDVLFCWNKEQSSEKEVVWHLVSHLQRSVHPIKPITVDDNQPIRAGIAVNVFFNKNGLINLLKKLDSVKWVDKILIRFHPNTTPIKYFSEVEEICFAISESEPEYFFENIDLLFCGRTSLIKDALLWGVPVAFDASLDVERKVSYGHLTDNIIIDMTGKQLDIEYIKEINLFYQDNKWEEKRNQWFLTDPRAESLNKAMKYLLVVDGKKYIN